MTAIPVLDATDWLAARSGALEPLAAELRRALEEVGFYYLTGHGVPHTLIDRVFAAARDFHAQPLDAKMALRAGKALIGYMPVNGYTSRSSRIEQARHPNLVEAFFVRREQPAAPYPNRWPEAGSLPGFRATLTAYCEAMAALCASMLPVYARALDLAPDYFAAAFAEPQYTLRLSHYPPAQDGLPDQYGVAPHTDSSFLTMLAQPELPGLSIRLPAGDWIDAPVVSGALIVNSGDLLRRWTNHRFLSTPHRVRNANAARDRYAVPFFFDAAADYPMAVLPSCVSANNPARYEPTTYREYMRWFAQQYRPADVQEQAQIADPAPDLAP